MVQRKKAVNPPWSNTYHSPSCLGVSGTGPLGLSQKNTKTTQLSAPLRMQPHLCQARALSSYRDSKRYRNRKSRKETERVRERQGKKIDEKGQKQRLEQKGKESLKETRGIEI